MCGECARVPFFIKGCFRLNAQYLRPSLNLVVRENLQAVPLVEEQATQCLCDDGGASVIPPPGPSIWKAFFLFLLFLPKYPASKSPSYSLENKWIWFISMFLIPYSWDYVLSINVKEYRGFWEFRYWIRVTPAISHYLESFPLGFLALRQMLWTSWNLTALKKQ